MDSKCFDQHICPPSMYLRGHVVAQSPYTQCIPVWDPMTFKEYLCRSPFEAPSFVSTRALQPRSRPPDQIHLFSIIICLSRKQPSNNNTTTREPGIQLEVLPCHALTGKNSYAVDDHLGLIFYYDTLHINQLAQLLYANVIQRGASHLFVTK